VNESPSNLVACRDQLRLSRPGSWFFAAGGGLGFGLPAALGVQMARPDRPVIAVVGEGSAHYAITALWTAVQRSVPVTFLVLRNDEYAILKFFGDLEGEKGMPGLDLPGLDTVAVAEGYGMETRRAASADELRAALEEAIGAEEPRLLEVPIQPGMSLG
jgi:benzoylformate decarboxylase